MAVLVARPDADNSKPGFDYAQPPCVGPVPAAMMSQLQDGAILDQVGDVPLPERPLPGLAVAGQQQGKRPMLDPDADGVLILVLKVLRRLGEDRQSDRPEFDPPGAG